MTCDRCGKEGGWFTGSYFNTETICERCDRAERSHPLFGHAKAVEAEQVRNGNFNYEGIGLPPDLEVKR